MAQAETGETVGEEEIVESVIRGAAKFVNEAEVEVEESTMGAARVVVRSSVSLVRAGVDMTREDAERVRDELTAALAGDGQ